MQCGGGTKTRAVTCLDTETGGVVSDSFCLVVEAKPLTQEPCNTQDCILGAFEQTTLDAHNNIRSLVSNGNLGDEPQAEPDLQPMVWDSALASAAAEWSTACNFAHSTISQRQASYIANGGVLNQGNWIGSSLFANSTTNADPSIAVNQWASEHENYSYQTNSCSGVCGHYTQIVWDDSVRVGCARTNCPTLTGFLSGGDFTVCYYYPGGNFNGQLPYSTL